MIPQPGKTRPNALRGQFLCLAAASAALCSARDARAFRMIQSSVTGRTTVGTRVTCDDAGGFAHRNQLAIAWRLNPATQGGESGVVTALQNSLAAWTAVTPAAYTLSYDGTTNAGFVTDGINTVSWGTGNGCTGGCLAITALVLGPGQVINEADISFNDAFDWNCNGTDYDVQAIAMHELGHSMGIHHTEITKPRNRPTMYASYFGIEGRSLEADDRDALNCAYTRYPPTGAAADLAPGDTPDDPEPASDDSRLASQSLATVVTLRFEMKQPGRVRLEVFDVAGRRVAALVDGMRDAGRYEVAWTGDARAGRARRGTYFARLETPAGRSGATVFLGR